MLQGAAPSHYGFRPPGRSLLHDIKGCTSSVEDRPLPQALPAGGPVLSAFGRQAAAMPPGARPGQPGLPAWISPRAAAL